MDLKELAIRLGKSAFERQFQAGDLVWFDPDVGYFLPGIVVDFSRGAQVATIESEIGGQVSGYVFRWL